MFNKIFDTAIIPDTWLNGVILPIYKNKGDPSLPENYRPITILSCLGKLFTSVIIFFLKTRPVSGKATRWLTIYLSSTLF